LLDALAVDNGEADHQDCYSNEQRPLISKKPKRSARALHVVDVEHARYDSNGLVQMERTCNRPFAELVGDDNRQKDERLTHEEAPHEPCLRGMLKRPHRIIWPAVEQVKERAAAPDDPAGFCELRISKHLGGLMAAT